MNPNLRMAAALLTAAVIWLPTAMSCVRGTTPLDDTAIGRLIVAFGFAWIATGLLAWLLHTYTRESDADPVDAELLVDHDRRRATD